MISKSFKIEQIHYDELKKIGYGNASLGFRILITEKFKHINDNNLNKNTLTKKTIKKSRTSNDSVVKESQLIKKAYFDAYSNKYGSEPVWAAKENRLANTLIASVGIDLAIKLAEFYPTYIDPWHVKQRHSFSLLVSQVAKIKTDYINQKHLVDARVFEKDFDKKVDEYSWEAKSQVFKQESELSRIAYNISLISNPELKDYEFDFDLFMFENNIDVKLSYHKKKQLLENLAKRIDHDKNRLL